MILENIIRLLNMQTLLINLISGPGSGKTTMAALLFSELKMRGYIVEYVQEYAKKLVWLKDFDKLNNQYLVTKKQVELFEKISGNVQIIVTDACILHGLYYNQYNPDNVSNLEKTEKLIIESYHEFNNYNFFLKRGNFRYETNGRIQTEEESKDIDIKLKKYLKMYNIPYQNFLSDKENINEMANEIEKQFKKLLE